VADNTEDLRDIFQAVADDDTVTETQRESPGTLTDQGGSRERLLDVVEAMREDHPFDSDLDDAALATVVERFYEDAGDAAIADDLGVPRDAVFRARMDLHLVRDRDTDAPFDLDALADHPGAGRSTAAIAADLEVSPSTVRRYRRVVDARSRARGVSHRFRSAFEDVLLEAEVRDRFTEAIAEDGLEDATEGTETNVSF